MNRNVNHNNKMWPHRDPGARLGSGSSGPALRPASWSQLTSPAPAPAPASSQPSSESWPWPCSWSASSTSTSTSSFSSSSSSSSSSSAAMTMAPRLKPVAVAPPRPLLLRSRLAFIAITLTFTVSLVLLALTREAHSLNCYTCSSADNPACDEPFTGRANFTDSTDCESHIGTQAKVCRKIVQYIEDKKVVIRSCGWIDERAEEKKAEKKPMCYKRSGTFALMMESCVCYEDNCNHSASLVPNREVLTLLAACSIVYSFYLTSGQQGPLVRAYQPA